MTRRRVLVIAVTVCSALAWIGLGGIIFASLSGPAQAISIPGASHSIASTALPVPNVSSPTSGSLSPAPAGGLQNAGAEMAAKALAATRAAGLKPWVAYVPRPSATPAQVAEAKQTGAASPLYTGSPAPMGLADYGLTAGGDVYVANQFSDSVSVINGATGEVVATIPVGYYPTEMAFDSQDSSLYVANQNSDNVSVVSTVTDSTYASIPVGAGPWAAAYDSENGDVYVTNYDSDNVSVISTVTNTVLTSIPIYQYPQGVTFDPANGNVYVSSAYMSAVFVISGADNEEIQQIYAYSAPEDMAYDSQNGNIYAANYGNQDENLQGGVTVISGTNNTVIAAIPGQNGSYGAAYDSGNGDIYVSSEVTDSVTVVSGSTNLVVATVPVGLNPTGVAYDPANGDVYVADYVSDNTTVLNGTTNTVVASIPVGINPVGVVYGSGASTLNTTAIQGYVDAASTGIRGEDLYQSSPDGFSIQMNAVLTGVTLQGYQNYSFWTQDVLTYFPATGYMFLVSNVWNFSRPNDTVTNATIYSHGPSGTNQYGVLGYYYATYAVPQPETYPFNVTLTTLSSVTDGLNNVSFSASVWSPTNYHDDFNMTDFDWVIFHSMNSTSPEPVSVPSNFMARGSGYNNVGLWDDFELVITGPGGGSQVDLSSADATLGLAYSSTNGTFAAVPSAYDYGSDTGETSTGINIAWNDAWADSPGVVPYATATTGPSILTGLWGNDAPKGSSPLYVGVFPSNAFVFLSYDGAANFSTPIVHQFEYDPSIAMSLSSLNLMPGTYQVIGELTGFDPANYTITLPTAFSINVTLTPDTSQGVYTPLWAFGNAEVANIAQSGNGTPGNPYVLYHKQPAPISSLFGLYNDYAFPVFPGVFLKDTSVSVELNNSSTFQTYTNGFQPSPYQYLPTTNDLQYWFWNVSGVALHNATNISGWFGRQGYFPLTFNSFNVVFYESAHNLVANNVFLSESQGLLMYSGGTQFGSQNIGGGNNTVWGNKFLQIDPPVGCPGPGNCSALLPYVSGLALEIGENSDLVYNNLFATPTTAWLLPLNLYSGSAELFVQTSWNITPQPASNVHNAPGFPTIPLSGNIVNGSTQGGNSWWDYGVSLNWANGADNPTGVLPYDENASNLISPLPGYGSPLPGYSCIKYYCKTYIYSGGDYAPLAEAAQAATIRPSGLPSGTVWGAVVFCEPVKGTPGGGPPGSVCCQPVKGTPGGGQPGCSSDPPSLVFGQFHTKAPSVSFVLPTGEFNWTPIVSPGYTSSTGGSFAVTPQAPVVVSVPYAPPGKAVLTFSESGLIPGLTWQVTVASAPAKLTTDGGTDDLSFTEALGSSYPYTISGIPGWQQSTLPYSGSVLVNSAPTTEPTLVYTQVVYPVSFSESGLPSGQTWTVTFNAVQRSLTANGGTDTLTFAAEPNGSYGYSIASNPGYHENTIPYSGSETVIGTALTVSVSYGPVLYAVSFAESGLPSGLTWKVTFNSVAMSLTTDGKTDTLTFSAVPNGTYAYSIAGNAGYHESALSYNGSLAVSGLALVETLKYVPVTYSVTFSESGLPSGLTWKVTFNGVAESLTTNGKTDTLTFPAVPNGTYSYTIAPNAGYHETTIPYSGTETVRGAPLAVSVTYSSVTYSLTFWEAGLPAGLTWKVTVNGVAKSVTTNGILNWLTWTGLANGTYAYSITDNPGWHQYFIPYNGKITVNGGSVSEVLVYFPVVYPITFSESGLPSGITWTVTVAGVTQHLKTNGGTDTLTWTGFVNGTYSYSITSISGWHQSTLPASGNVVVKGASVTEPTLHYTH